MPSRVFPGSFFALPQSPQLYKQLTMLAGFDRYMQIARCFRDEDLRADRQPEFTQIDLEMSFIDEEDIMSMAEGFVKTVYKEVLDVEIQTPFPRMTYAEGMERFGSDKPDLRFGYELKNLTEVLKGTEFRVFAGAVSAGGSVRGINVKGGCLLYTSFRWKPTLSGNTQTAAWPPILWDISARLIQTPMRRKSCLLYTSRCV